MNTISTQSRVTRELRVFSRLGSRADGIESRAVVSRSDYKIARSRLRWLKNNCPLDMRARTVGEMIRIAAQERDDLTEYWAIVSAMGSMRMYDFRC